MRLDYGDGWCAVSAVPHPLIGDIGRGHPGYWESNQSRLSMATGEWSTLKVLVEQPGEQRRMEPVMDKEMYGSWLGFLDRRIGK